MFFGDLEEVLVDGRHVVLAFVVGLGLTLLAWEYHFRKLLSCGLLLLLSDITPNSLLIILISAFAGSPFILKCNDLFRL